MRVPFIRSEVREVQRSTLARLPGVAAWWFAIIAGAGTLALSFLLSPVSAQTPNLSAADFVKQAKRLRAEALRMLEPQVVVPTESRALFEGKYPWKRGIVTTLFWIGEPAGQNNPVNNVSSSWDFHWQRNYGGYDNPNPTARRHFIPAGFVPRQNPFYCALPYNDVAFGRLKPEAHVVIPWFREAFKEEGKSVCQGRWLAIRNGDGKVCFAQWLDCGPFRTDHWQYVFGNDRPKSNLNHDAGLDVSPAVRDYLSLASTDVTDWKFVEASEVREGPWKTFGESPGSILGEHGGEEQLADAVPQPAGPTVILK